MRTVLRVVVLSALTSSGFAQADDPPPFVRGPVLANFYDGTTDDLLTAGLGKTGLAGAAPGFLDPLNPTAAELRRNAIYNNYRALVDMTPGGGYGVLYGPNIDLDGNDTLGEGRIAGHEYLAYADDGTGEQNVTLMVQVPTTFDPANPCIVTATSSGSRGVYGAIATSGEWGLKRGCAVAYTDKGTGMGVHDLQANTVNLIRGERADADGAGDASNFTADLSDAARMRFNGATPNRFAFKHAHSQQNPEADWGTHTLQAVELAFWVLNEHHAPGSARYTPDNTIVIASSVSNGGGAALRAAEQDQRVLIDGVAVTEPNVTPFPRLPFRIVQEGTAPVAAHSRPLFDYITLMNLYQPCASLAPANAEAPFNILPPALAANRCLSLYQKGLLRSADVAAQAEEAQRILNDAGLLIEQNVLAPSYYALSVPQAVAVTYANSYGRFSVADNLCGFSFGATDAAGNPIPAPEAAVATIFATGNGIPPTGGINIINNDSVGGPRADTVSISPSTSRQDLNIDGALCLRALATGRDPVTGRALSGRMRQHHTRIQNGIREIRASARLDVPVLIAHGRSDPLLPPNHTSRAYYGASQMTGGNRGEVRYYEVTNAHHLDALNPLPGYSERMLPLHVYLTQALNLMYAHLTTGAPLPPSQVVHTTPRAMVGGVVQPIAAANVPPIRQTPDEGSRITFENGTLRIPE
jgi:hydroxybutyrate-dimer hydrolase